MTQRFNELKNDTEKYDKYKTYISNYIMDKYRTDETFKNTILERKKNRYQEVKKAHYLRWDTDEEYKKECKAKGMRDCRARNKNQ